MDCVFCKIVSGEFFSYTIYEDDATLAFLDIHPVSHGHTLVIPKNPEPQNIFDIESDDWKKVSEIVRKVAVALEKSLRADGVNIMMNNREHAGQVVFHPHVHVIPRFKNDGLKLWPHGSYKDGEAVLLQEKIRAQLAS